MKQLLQNLQNEYLDKLSEQETALPGMLQTIATLLDRMQSEVGAEPLYATD